LAIVFSHGQAALPGEHSLSSLNSSHTANVFLYRFWITAIGEDAGS
jgi:hypothetical protein